ncbi:MAG: VTT domain-containing protein [bacterium]|nr:VTT domain-containing protein [bacterium]
MEINFFGQNLIELIELIGYVGLFAIIFAESGLFFGFFLPGDSLLFAAGILAAQGFFNIWLLVVLLALAAILGDNAGYWFGQKAGPRLFVRDDSLFFRKRYVKKSGRFYEKHGVKAVILARFMPVARTFVPIFAGVAKMSYRTFLRYNIAGALLWAVGMTLLGFFLGASVPNIEEILTPLLALVIVLSFLPVVLEMRRAAGEEKESFPVPAPERGKHLL